MNSDERRAARRERREEERARKKAERQKECTFEDIADLGNLHKAAKTAAKGVGWKASTQRYQKDILRNIVKARQSLLNGEDICKGFIRFDLYERGKLRHISSVHFSERVIHKSLSVNALVPAFTPTLIAANSANQKDKGTHYAVKLMKRQLADHYRRHGTEGYILQVDFSDYFGSIAHQPLKDQIDRTVVDRRVAGLTKHLIDVQGDVGLGLGSEPNQICAVSFPNEIDHLVTEMCGVEAYGRYMDDSYAIDVDKATLEITLAVIRDRCAKLGITVNEKKTRIVKLTHGFTYLKKKFSYGPNGKIVVRPCRDSITRERRKLKKQKALYDQGLMTYEQVEQSYQSWRGGMKHLDAHKTLLSMDALFAQLFSNCNNGGGVGTIVMFPIRMAA